MCAREFACEANERASAHSGAASTAHRLSPKQPIEPRSVSRQDVACQSVNCLRECWLSSSCRLGEWKGSPLEFARGVSLMRSGARSNSFASCISPASRPRRSSTDPHRQRALDRTLSARLCIDLKLLIGTLHSFASSCSQSQLGHEFEPICLVCANETKRYVYLEALTEQFISLLNEAVNELALNLTYDPNK